jgi:hypothetical protein
MRPIAVATAVLCAGLAFSVAPGAAQAQCIVDYEATFDPPVTALGGMSEVLSKGTFDCGVVQGELCGSGLLEGSCLSSTVTSRVVSCVGTCTASPGGVVTCDGQVSWIGESSGSCASGGCLLEGHGDDGSVNGSLIVPDPETVSAGVDACGVGGSGTSHGKFHGVATIPVPPNTNP